MEEQSFGAFSWLWGGFGVGGLCLLRAWDISDIAEGSNGQKLPQL